MSKSFLGFALLASVGFVTGCSTAPKSEADRDALVATGNASVQSFRAKDSSLGELLSKSAGWAVFPEVGKAGFIVGGSYGRGTVYQNGSHIGYADITSGSVGLQAGAQSFSELLIFMRQSDLDKFKSGQFSLEANASAIAITAGAAAKTDVGKGVIVFVDPKGGLMADASVGGQGFSYKPK
ncbi:MAG: lipid-binding SYLF domain-containing protein [Phycisphaerales bacterium]|nr:lipid-binding SYLF domain-containing protein [Phycisphaerales bacterium]